MLHTIRVVPLFLPKREAARGKRGGGGGGGGGGERRKKR